MPGHALIHCNAGGEFGMGHLMRSLAIGEQAIAEGWSIALAGDLSDHACALASAHLPEADVAVFARGDAAARLRAATTSGVDVLHLDTYWLAATDVPPGEHLVSNMQDAEFGARPADLAIDGNLGAEARFQSTASAHLVGTSAALIRTQVLRQRGLAPAPGGGPRILVVLGGTDPHRLTEAVTRALLELETPTRMTVICGDEQKAQVAALSGRRGHDIQVAPFADDLPALARDHDLVVSAAGTSVWDFAAMGAPMALVCVTENQMAGYRAAVAAGLGIPLGEPPHFDLRAGVERIEALLRDDDGQTRLRAHLMQSVDGRGAWRAVASWSQLRETSPSVPTQVGVSATPAAPADARMLHEWRNDSVTRAQSRSKGDVSWNDHITWLERTLQDPRRLLLIVHDGDTPVGTVRWDATPDGWEVSITVAPDHRGQGHGAAILAAGEAALPASLPARMLASVHTDNVASKRLFARAGYLPYLPADKEGFATYAKWRFSG